MLVTLPILVYVLKMDAHAAMLAVQEHMVTLARAHADHLALRWFDEALERVADPALTPWLERLGALHALTRLYDESGFYYEQGYFDVDKGRAIRNEATALMTELAGAAVPLASAFAIPEPCLAAPIAFMDPARPRW